jgi:hypothetical protein
MPLMPICRESSTTDGNEHLGSTQGVTEDMWKLLAMAVAAAVIILSSQQVQALPNQVGSSIQQLPTAATPVGHNRSREWRGYSRHHGQNYSHHNDRRHYRPNYHYRPYYRPYYEPYWGWNYCNWGYDGWSYGCFDNGYLGGYYGGYYDYNDYYDRGDYPRRERVSNKKHVKWCKARYKTYNSKTDTFIGKGKKKFRCNSPYDGRR